ncbi:MAG: oxidoreductase, partial [Clostridia bacterium]|nr:oxidoreductase [Clostridia bacterium]
GKGTSHTFDTLPRVKPEMIAKRSLAASKKGRAMYTGRLFYKFYRLLSRIVPHKILMIFAQT